MFSDMRDISLHNINTQSDHVYYGDGEIVDINIYSNMKELKSNKVNKQLLQYYNDAKWFYTKVYKTCKAIVKSGSTKIDKEIHRWMRLAMNYLDTNAVWAFNDNVFSGMMVEILIRRKECMNIGRKIVGRSGNKTVICSIWKDEEMVHTNDTNKSKMRFENDMAMTKFKAEHEEKMQHDKHTDEMELEKLRADSKLEIEKLRAEAEKAKR